MINTMILHCQITAKLSESGTCPTGQNSFSRRVIFGTTALKVISRTSVMQYKDAKEPLPEIARELNVKAIITGSVHAYCRMGLGWCEESIPEISGIKPQSVQHLF